jgi:hypothetical protein
LYAANKNAQRRAIFPHSDVSILNKKSELRTRNLIQKSDSESGNRIATGLIQGFALWLNAKNHVRTKFIIVSYACALSNCGSMSSMQIGNKFRIEVVVEESEPVAKTQSTPGETKVSRGGGNADQGNPCYKTFGGGDGGKTSWLVLVFIQP